MTLKIVFKITVSLVLQTAYQESHLGEQSVRDYAIKPLSLLPTLEGEAYFKSIFKHTFEKLLQLPSVLRLLLAPSSWPGLHRPAQGTDHGLQHFGGCENAARHLLHCLELERKRRESPSALEA